MEPPGTGWAGLGNPKPYVRFCREQMIGFRKRAGQGPETLKPAPAVLSLIRSRSPLLGPVPDFCAWSSGSSSCFLHLGVLCFGCVFWFELKCYSHSCFKARKLVLAFPGSVPEFRGSVPDLYVFSRSWVIRASAWKR